MWLQVMNGPLTGNIVLDTLNKGFKKKKSIHKAITSTHNDKDAYSAILFLQWEGFIIIFVMENTNDIYSSSKKFSSY